MARPLLKLKCPACKKFGSGMHTKWVLNSQKKKYFPYYYFAHSVNGKVKWCYIPKKIAEAILRKESSKRKTRR